MAKHDFSINELLRLNARNRVEFLNLYNSFRLSIDEGRCKVEISSGTPQLVTDESCDASPELQALRESIRHDLILSERLKIPFDRLDAWRLSLTPEYYSALIAILNEETEETDA